MTKEQIKAYFTECSKNNDTVPEYDIPSEMQADGAWSVMDSTLAKEDLADLERQFNLKLPREYCDYIMAAAHMFTELTGNFNNFLFEDDVDVVMQIPPQPYKEELKYIKEMIEENSLLVGLGYLPIGTFDSDGYLYIDLENQNRLVWLPFDNCVGFTTREEFESEEVLIFETLDEYIKCFFGGETYTIPDEEE